MRRGRYRWRTWLRRRLPGALAGLAPKGRRNCGHHDLYYDRVEWRGKVRVEVWRCYHCEPGESRRITG